MEKRKIANISEMANCRVGPGGSCNMYMGYLSPFSVQGHLGALGAHVSNWPITRKPLAIGRNGMKFWSRG